MEENYKRLLVDLFWNKDGFEAIRNAGQLSSKEKTVILKLYQEQKSIACIAKKMRVSTQRVYQIKKSAMDGVRTELYVLNFGAGRETRPVNIDNLSTRTRNALMRKGLHTAEDIIGYMIEQKEEEPMEAIQHLRGIGKNGAKEILTMLKSQSYKLPSIKQNHMKPGEEKGIAKHGGTLKQGVTGHGTGNVLVLDSKERRFWIPKKMPV